MPQVVVQNSRDKRGPQATAQNMEDYIKNFRMRLFKQEHASHFVQFVTASDPVFGPRSPNWEAFRRGELTLVMQDRHDVLEALYKTMVSFLFVGHMICKGQSFERFGVAFCR